MNVLRAGVALLALLVCPPLVAGQSRVSVSTEPGTPVVATEILLSVGPADEDEGRAGLAHLAARAAVAPILPALDSLGAHLTLLPQKDAISFSLVSAPDVWEPSTELLVEALFRESPDSVAVLTERRAIVAELRGRSANPADAATRAIDRAFFGADHPWGRPTLGTPEGVERLTFRHVDLFLRDHFTPDRAFAAVAGPVGESEARSHLGPLLGTTFAAPVEMIPFESEEEPVRREYNSITTWVAASFRFPEGGDEEAIRFIGYLAAADLSFSPLQRSVYDVQSEVVTRLGGGEIRLQIVVPPEESELWEERVAGVLERLAGQPMLADVFANHIRRYRGERLMALASPEDRAHAAARRLLLTGEVDPLVPDLEEMTQARVRAAADSLGEPTLVILGPSLDN